MTSETPLPGKTHLPGKDAALEDTIADAAALLRSHGFPIELTSWKNPVQHCWSVHLRSLDCPQLYTNGKGASRLASQASAMLEFFERISTNLFFADYYLGSETASSEFVYYPEEKWFPVDDPLNIPTHGPGGVELLSAELREFYDPTGELTPGLLHDNNCDNEGRGISALPFEHLERAETVYFPVSLLNNLYVSNGMAAGNSAAECRAQALSEILERHVKGQVIARGICLPDVPPSVIRRHPQIQAALTELRGHGFSVQVKDASLGGQFPVVCVLLVNPKNGGCYASFGASCRFEVALERTVTELLQGRALHQLDTFQPPSHDLDAVADSFNLESHFIDSDGRLSWRMFRDRPDFSFAEWNFHGSSTEEEQRLREIILGCGHDAYCASYAHCGIYTCRIIVPGMSEIYPIDDLVWNNKGSGATLRPRLLKLGRSSIHELRGLFQELTELGLSDQQPIAEVIGVIFEEGSAWQSLRVGELKAMLTLAAGDLQEAARWCGWCLGFDHLPAPRQRLYRAIHDLLALESSGEDPANYRSSLELFYGNSLIAQAAQIVKGELTFHGLDFASRWEDLSPAHAKILSIYHKLHRLKRPDRG